MRTTLEVFRSVRFVLSSRWFTIVGALGAVLMTSAMARADNQYVYNTSTSSCCAETCCAVDCCSATCCPTDCAASTCNHDAEIYFVRQDGPCVPDCQMWAYFVQEDTGCSLSNFAFVDDVSTCEAAAQASLIVSFSIGAPFTVTEAELLQIDTNPDVGITASGDGAIAIGKRKKVPVDNKKVPAVSTWALGALGVLVLSAGTIVIRRGSTDAVV